MFGDLFKKVFVRIEALILAVSLSLVGLMYGNEPIKLEVSTDLLDSGETYNVQYNDIENITEPIEVEKEELYSIYLHCKNVGTPFKGKFTIFADKIEVYRLVDEKEVIVYSKECQDGDHEDIIVKRNEEFTKQEAFEFKEDTENGIYSIRVYVYGNEYVYENAILVK